MRATSYPYLSVAKAYGVDYWRVLKFADLLDERPPNQDDWYLPKMWMVATCVAYRNEQNRRMGPTITVRPNINPVGTIKEWD